MGLLGMEKPGRLGLTSGETKMVYLSPELAYGTDLEAHELGGLWLTFELALRLSS